MALELGTYRTAEGELLHCHADDRGLIVAERELADGRRVRVDGGIVLGAVKLSDDPNWPDVVERLPAILVAD